MCRGKKQGILGINRLNHIIRFTALLFISTIRNQVSYYFPYIVKLFQAFIIFLSTVCFFVCDFASCRSNRTRVYLSGTIAFITLVLRKARKIEFFTLHASRISSFSPLCRRGTKGSIFRPVANKIKKTGKKTHFARKNGQKTLSPLQRE